MSSIDYRNILEDDSLRLHVEEVEGLVGNRMSDFLEFVNEYAYSTDIKLLAVRFEDGQKFGGIVFDDLTIREYDFENEYYHFSMHLYEFRGEVVKGRLIRFHKDEDHEEEIDLVGFDDSSDALNPVMMYVIDKIRDRI